MTPNGTGSPMRPLGSLPKPARLRCCQEPLSAVQAFTCKTGEFSSAASLIAEADDISTTKPAGCQ